MRGIPLFCLVFHCAGFGGECAMWDAAHSGTQSCARARANSTMPNIGKAIVQNGIAFVQNGTTRCNARALFLIVPNQYNAVPSNTVRNIRVSIVLDCTGSGACDTEQYNQGQRYTMCKTPPALTPTPTPIIIIHSHTEKFVLHILSNAAVL